MSSPTPKPSFASWAGWAVAAILAVVASYFAASSLGTRAQLLVQKDQAELNALELRSLHQSVEANRIINDRQIADLQRGSSLDQLKISTLIPTAKDAKDVAVLAVWNPAKQEGVLSVQGLPKIEADENYQLWLITADQKTTVSGGTFSVDEIGRASCRERV